MKYARMPGSIFLIDQLTGDKGEEMSIKKMAFAIWFTDNRWNVSKEAREALQRMVVEFRKKENEVMKFEAFDLKILVDIINSPQAGQNGTIALFQPLVQMQLQPHCDVILNATDANPDEEIGASNGRASAHA